MLQGIDTAMPVTTSETESGDCHHSMEELKIKKEAGLAKRYDRKFFFFSLSFLLGVILTGRKVLATSSKISRFGSAEFDISVLDGT
jgi:hypothetical protein